LVSVVIPTYNRADKLDRLLRSVREMSYTSLEIIVVDNAASTATAAVVAGHPGVRYVPLERNVYSGGARAVGEALSHGDHVLFIDDDNVASRALISRLVDAMEADQSIGVAGPLMYLFERPQEVWCAGGFLTRLGLIKYGTQLQNGPGGIASSGVPAGLDVGFFPNCFLVRRSVFRRGVCFDPDIFPHNWSEPDFCFRARLAGFRVVLVPSALEYHDVGYSGPLTRMTGAKVVSDQARSRVAFRKRHLAGWGNWAAFAFIVFPLSTALYVVAISRSGEVWSCLKAYAKGTLEGLRQDVPPLPREWDQHVISAE
jgi:hypothetical protein